MYYKWLSPMKVLTGICTLAACSFGQSYTISAKPGAVNFIEGDVTLNGEPVFIANLKSTFLKADDVLAISHGKAEILLTPGVFLRVGENAKVRMVTPSLVQTRLEIISGESMVEVDDIVPDSSVVVMDHGSETTLLKPGLYRFDERSIAALDGRAEVAFGDKKMDLKKNKQIQIDDPERASKLDLTQGDDLYAWSNVRSQYSAAATYVGARDAYNSGGYGYSSFMGPGWYWSSPFSTYMWMPGNGAFYSPFGWGFYGPGVVAYAPVIAYPYGGYGYGYGNWRPQPGSGAVTKSGGIVVPVNPSHPGVVTSATNVQGSSPAAFAAARAQMQQAVSVQGLRTASGAPAANLRGGQTFSNMRQASQAASASSHAAAASSNGGGWSGGGNSSGRSSGSSAMPAATSHSSGGSSHK